jgi:glycosyltransferase involved in cell wall biosynthesis
MRLLYVTDALINHGGMERVLIDKLNWLVEHERFDICLLLTDHGDNPIVYPLSPEVECCDLGIMFHKIYRFSVWKRPLMLYRLHQRFRQRLSEIKQKFSPDIIVCVKLCFISDVVKIQGNIPVVYESHNSFIANKLDNISLFQKIRMRFWYHTLKRVQMIVALTQSDAKEWKKLNPHVQVVPNIAHLNPIGRLSDCHSKSVIFVGRYSYQKDIPSLMRIWALVHQRHPDWELHIFGGYGPLQIELQQELCQMDSNVYMHQPTYSIFEEYIKNSILLLTSRYEPFGLVLPEAMSCGLPVVAFDCPYGPADIISDGVNGFLISNRDINAYVEKVCLLMEDVNLRKRLGKAGTLSSHKYQASVIMPQWIQLFNEISQKSK